MKLSKSGLLNFLNNKHGKSFLCLLTIVLIYSAYSYVFFAGSDPSIKTVLDTNHFDLSAGEYINGVGCTINPTTANDTTFWAIRDDIALRKGSYRVTITYETDTDGNYLTIASPDQSVNTIKADTFRLRSDLNSVSGIIRINDTKPDFILQAAYDGTGYLTIKNILIEQTNDRLLGFCTSTILLLCFFSLCILLIKLVKTQTQKNITFGLILICFISSLPLCVDYLFFGHDLGYHLMRIEGICEGLRNGMFPVKIHPNVLHELGYASPVMYGDIFLYFPALLRFLGYTITDAYKVYLLIVNIATCLVSYWCIKQIFHNEYIGLFGSMLYTLSAYRFTDVYLRAALGEYTAIIFLPLIFYGLYLIFDVKEEDTVPKKGIVLSVIGFSGIIQTHVLTCEMAGIFVIFACILLWKKTFRKKTFWALTKVVLITTLINLWWLVPFFDYRKEELIVNYRWNDYIQTEGTFIAQLLTPITHVNGISLDAALGLKNEFPITLELNFFFCIIIFFYLFLFGKKLVNRKNSHFAIATMAGGLFALFMTTFYFPYDKLSDAYSLVYKYLNAIQFPWRFMIIAILLITISTCAVIELYKSNYKPELSRLLFIAISISTIVPYLYSISLLFNTFTPYRPYDFTALATNEIGTGEYLPWGVEVPSCSALDYIAGENVTLNEHEKEALTIWLNVKNNASEESYIEVPLLYYKGYVASDTLNNMRFPVCRGNKGLVHVTIPADYSGNITIQFHEPWYWRAAEIFSLLFLLSWIIWELTPKYRKHSN